MVMAPSLLSRLSHLVVQSMVPKPGVIMCAPLALNHVCCMKCIDLADPILTLLQRLQGMRLLPHVDNFDSAPYIIRLWVPTYSKLSEALLSKATQILRQQIIHSFLEAATARIAIVTLSCTFHKSQKQVAQTKTLKGVPWSHRLPHVRYAGGNKLQQCERSHLQLQSKATLGHHLLRWSIHLPKLQLLFGNCPSWVGHSGGGCCTFAVQHSLLDCCSSVVQQFCHLSGGCVGQLRSCTSHE